jgi:FkbM family methyltransferase
VSSKAGPEHQRANGMARALRGVVFGSPLESPARAIWSTAYRILPTARGKEFRRGARYDRMTVEIARRALASNANTIDAGANAGTVLKHLVRMAPSGQHFAIEPLPYLARRLAQRYPAVSVHEMALADYDGTARFRFVRDDPALSSLLLRPEREADTDVQEISVRVRRLDEVIPAHVPITFLKVDVEGAESALFRGAARVLRESRPVTVFESAIDTLEENVDLLRSAGLTVHLLEDYLAGRARGRGDLVRLAEEREEFMFVAAPG